MSLPLASTMIIRRSGARSALPGAPVTPDTPFRRSLFFRISESIQIQFRSSTLRCSRPTTRKAASCGCSSPVPAEFWARTSLGT